MSDVLTILAKLPPLCYTTLPADPTQTIAIKRGVMGFYPIHSPATAAELNSRLTPPPTPAQIEAMEVGSLFGWEVPGADPDYVREAVPTT